MIPRSSYPVRKSHFVMHSALEESAAMSRFDTIGGVNPGMERSMGDVVIAFLLQRPIKSVRHTAIRMMDGGEQV